MIDWQRAEILLFDMDGTVLDLNFDNHFWNRAIPQHYAELHGMAEHEATSELVPRFKAAEGRLDWYCVDYWSRELGLDVMAIKQNFAAGIAVLPGAEAFLAEQRAAGRRLWLVTNAHPQTLSLKLRHAPIGDYFERHVSSHDLGFPKEDARFWSAFSADCPVGAAQSVMFDDNHRVLEAAQAHGIGQLVRITRPDTLRPAAEFDAAAHGMVAVHGLADLLSNSV